MNDLERFEYDGSGKIEADFFHQIVDLKRLLIIDAKAVIPTLTEQPLLDRLEYEVVNNRMGWSSHGGIMALNGWESRVTELAAGFDAAILLTTSDRQVIAQSIRAYFASAINGARAWVWPLRALGLWKIDDRLADAVEEALSWLHEVGHRVGSVELFINEEPHVVDDLERLLAVREIKEPVTVRRVHPVLGLLSRHLPLPDEFQQLDDWLESVKPLPGEVKSLSED